MKTAEPPPAEAAAREFMLHRSRLQSIAYRLLGSAWDAEDVVAAALERWLKADRTQVREPVAYLTTVVTRLALDELKSARVARETYVGPWLPEPVLSDPGALGPLDTVEQREAVSLATMRLMEQLTPPQRAVLVLHEAFGVPHAEIAGILGISEQGARQHLRRARARMTSAAPEPRSRPLPTAHGELFDRFLAALEGGSFGELQALLAADVVAYTDGGGAVKAARHPLVGPDRVARFFSGLRKRLAVTDVRRVEVNGQPGAVLWFGRRRLLFSVDARDGEVTAVYSVVNPDKLGYLLRQLGEVAP